MPTTFLDTLPEAQRADLALCGIGSDAQLARGDARILSRDIARAREFFPELTPGLTEEQLTALIAAAQRAVNPEELPAAASLPHPKKARRPDPGMERAQRVESSASPSARISAIRFSHPVRIWFAAFSVLLLIPAGFLALYLIAIALMTPPEEIRDLLFPLLTLPILLAPYCLFGRYQECCVCHVQMFRFRGYHRHRNTARYFLLGSTFSTALRIMFVRPFYCPGCGTYLKLTRHHHSRS
ncbi:MAG: hypothetical protein ACI4OS_00100 [Akkermansia sp.]